MTKKINIPKDNNILKISLEEAMPDNYLPYAVEVAKDRALPDVRDGLKPVQRRILYGAYMLKAFPDRPYFKSARIVGDILGKYHPHGDSSVYDAMVILAQDFTTRKPLIDGHGNWGSIDGDSAAAMRYTEARLTPIAMEMMRDIDKGVVNMVDNYSDSELEPEVLPARYPNLLVNGTFGIAVGLATNIPPHNLNEVIDGVFAYIDNNDITTEELMNYIKGPDLPTGGILIGKNALLSAYKTGEGKVTMRAKTNIQRLDSGKIGIVISEFPYRRNKAKILQIISEMTEDKKHAKALEAILDIRDESDRSGIRGVIELKKSADFETAQKILKYLFSKTELQCNLSFNMVAISNGKPETLSLKNLISSYVDYQKEIIIKRSKRELEVTLKRLHIIEGFIKAIGIIDDVIKTIRASKSKKDAERNLSNEYGFTQVQAEAIVELMLYRLTGMEINTFLKEQNELNRSASRLKKVLGSDREILKVIKQELREIKNKYGDVRRTQIVEDDDKAKIDIEKLIVDEDIVVTMSNDGYIKRVSQKSYNRSNADVSDIEYWEGDFNRFLIKMSTKDSLIMFTNMGNMYKIKGVNIPEYKWKEKGEKIDSILKGLDISKEKTVSVYAVSDFNDGKDMMFFTTKGGIKKISMQKFDTSYSKLSAMKLKDDEKVINTVMVDGNRDEKYIKVLTKNKIEFSFKEPHTAYSDRNTYSEQLFSISCDDEIVSMDYTDEDNFREFAINISADGKLRVFSKRGSKKGINCNVNSSMKLLVFTDNGKVYLVPCFMFQNIGSDGINLSKIVDGFNDNEKILNAKAVSKFDENSSVYFFSKMGMVKKTMLSEFDIKANFAIAYKFKFENDTLISVQFEDTDSNSDILIVTKKAMCIRFQSDSVSTMGKIASGVIGISLMEDDEVKFASIIYDNKKRLEIISQKSGQKIIEFEDIKLQNRAGKGKSLMLIVLDDFVKDVFLKDCIA